MCKEDNLAGLQAKVTKLEEENRVQLARVHKLLGEKFTVEAANADLKKDLAKAHVAFYNLHEKHRKEKYEDST